MLLIRRATEHDAAAMLAIYRPYVERTAVSFETQPPAVAEFAARIAKTLERWIWLAAEENGKCVGYAYGAMHRERPAYRWSVETSTYIHDRYHRRGIGKALYTELLDQLAAIGYCNAYAGIALPNDASIALHKAVGFEPIGVFKRVGRKFDRWQDVAWFHQQLRDEPAFHGEHSATAP